MPALLDAAALIPAPSGAGALDAPERLHRAGLCGGIQESARLSSGRVFGKLAAVGVAGDVSAEGVRVRAWVSSTTTRSKARRWSWMIFLLGSSAAMDCSPPEFVSESQLSIDHTPADWAEQLLIRTPGRRGDLLTRPRTCPFPDTAFIGSAPGRGTGPVRFSARHRPPHSLQVYPLISELADDGIPVAVTCRVLKLARQPYYRWLANPITAAEINQAYRANALFDAHHDDPEFGYRYLVEEARDAGQPMAERAAWRICSETAGGACSARNAARTARSGRRSTTIWSSATSPPRAKSVVAQRYHRASHRRRKLYLCAIKDVFSNRIVGYSIDSRMKSRLASRAQ